MKVTVYLGANMGDSPSFKEATIALGRWIAKNGHTLVYGGSKMGLMGVLGDTVLENGGQVHGIMPQFLKDREIAYEGLTSMTIVETMAERKTAMLECNSAQVQANCTDCVVVTRDNEVNAVRITSIG